MSFILDALKKAESERSRQSGPVLMDVRIAAPRRLLPAWAWVLGAVLLANLGVLGWLLLRAPPSAPAALTTQLPPALPAPVAAVAPVSPPVIIPTAPPVTPVVPAMPLPALIPEVVPETLPAAAAAAADTPLDVDKLPTMQDLMAAGVTLPAMQLNLHVYDEAPANRYVLLNSRRMREGDELPDGIRLVRITASGVVLNARGRLFLLAAGG